MKYSTHSTDFEALQRELGTSSPGGADEYDEAPADEDEYSDWAGTER